jgi:catechol 2,3-dioxygenase-like lactoylglutathione lyase family enzyme
MKMSSSLLRVGTSYIPVKNVEESAQWYVNKLRAKLSYQDKDKAIINLANQSFFLVAAKNGQHANFFDVLDNEWFSMTFEVDGLSSLEELHKEFKEQGIQVGEIENRGHSGRNFIFRDPNGNMFDVWSELSPSFKRSLEVSIHE